MQKYVRMRFCCKERCSQPARSTITKNKLDERGVVKENRASVPGPNNNALVGGGRPSLLGHQFLDLAQRRWGTRDNGL